MVKFEILYGFSFTFRAVKAGAMLADALILRDKFLGKRPISITAYSAGCVVVFECLKILSNLGIYGTFFHVFFVIVRHHTGCLSLWCTYL